MKKNTKYLLYALAGIGAYFVARRFLFKAQNTKDTKEPKERASTIPKEYRR